MRGEVGGSVFQQVEICDVDGVKYQICFRDKSLIVVLFLIVNCCVCVEDYDGIDSSNEYQVLDVVEQCDKGIYGCFLGGFNGS